MDNIYILFLGWVLGNITGVGLGTWLAHIRRPAIASGQVWMLPGHGPIYVLHSYRRHGHTDVTYRGNDGRLYTSNAHLLARVVEKPSVSMMKAIEMRGIEPRNER